MPDFTSKVVTSGPRLVQASEVSGDAVKLTFESTTRLYLHSGQLPAVREDEPLWRRLEPVDKSEEM